MPTFPYKLNDGTPVPSVTTVLSNLGWSKEGLMYWAWKLGTEGRDYRKVRKEAAGVGTVVHRMIEEHIKGNTEDSAALQALNEEDAMMASQSFNMYLKWEKRTKPKFRFTEVSLVSEKYRFGGTLDAVGEIDDEMFLMDFKTSNAVYPDHVIQGAAYRALWNEVHSVQLSEGFYLLRIGKEGGFHDHWINETALAWGAFLDLLDLHKIKKQIEGMI